MNNLIETRSDWARAERAKIFRINRYKKYRSPELKELIIRYLQNVYIEERFPFGAGNMILNVNYKREN